MANIVVDLHAAHGQRSLNVTIVYNDIVYVHQGHYQDIVKSIDIIKSIEFSCDIPWGYTSAVLNNLTDWVPIMSQPITAHRSLPEPTTAHQSPLQHTKAQHSRPEKCHSILDKHYKQDYCLPNLLANCNYMNIILSASKMHHKCEI